MIHSASPQSRPAVIVAWFWSFGTNTLYENSDHYRPGLWSASWINLVPEEIFGQCQKRVFKMKSQQNSISHCKKIDLHFTSLSTQKNWKHKLRMPGIFWSTRPTTVPACSEHYFYTECKSVRLSVPKLQNQATITVGWPSGSLMTPILS